MWSAAQTVSGGALASDGHEPGHHSGGGGGRTVSTPQFSEQFLFSKTTKISRSCGFSIACPRSDKHHRESAGQRDGRRHRRKTQSTPRRSGADQREPKRRPESTKSAPFPWRPFGLVLSLLWNLYTWGVEVERTIGRAQVPATMGCQRYATSPATGFTGRALSKY